MAWYNYPISHGYIPAYQGPGTDTPHYAVDIAAPQDTPFSFPTSGTISQADYAMWSGQPGGGEVFLKPDDGGNTQYVYHLDEIDVHPGQHVGAGQQVGLSGGQNSGGQHNTSPMWSSGAHIHYGFFQKYVSTPAGGRPYGPDPTSYVQNLTRSNGALLATMPGSTLVSPGASNTANALSGIFMPTNDQLIRGVLFIGGAILIFMALHSLLQKSQIGLPSLPQGSDTSSLQAATNQDAQASQKAARAEDQQNQAATRKYMRRFGRGIAPPPPSKAAEVAEVAEVAAV